MNLKDKYNFSEDQIKKILDIKNRLEQNNNLANRMSIVSDILFYKDNNGNFYCKYYSISWGTGDVSTGFNYLCIDREGKAHHYDRNISSDKSVIDQFDEFEVIHL